MNISANSTTTTTMPTPYTTNPRMVNGVIILILMIFIILGNGLVYYVYRNYFKVREDEVPSLVNKSIRQTNKHKKKKQRAHYFFLIYHS